MGGSTAAQRINCLASLKLEEKAPPKPQSDYATQGNVFHSAMELLLTALDPESANYEKEYRKALKDLEGQDLGYGEQWAITPEQITTKIIPAWHAFIQILNAYELQDWFIEQRVSLEEVIPGAFGTSDLIGIDINNRLHVLDWKFGEGVSVGVEGNMALAFYAAAALYDTEPELVEFCSDITSVVFHIVQPRVGVNQVLWTWETDEAFIEAFVDQAAAAMERAVRPDAPCKTGDWCRWCAAKPICPAYGELASEALSKPPKSMTAVELGHWLSVAEQLKSWIDDLYTLAQGEMETGAAVPGYKLVQKRASRSWINEAEVAKILRRRKIKIDEIYKRTLLSPAQAEKKLPKLYSKVLADLVHSQSSGLTVVSDTDKRSAVTSTMDLLANALPQEQTADRKQETGAANHD
jgi:hypothetical protein